MIIRFILILSLLAKMQLSYTQSELFSCEKGKLIDTSPGHENILHNLSVKINGKIEPLISMEEEYCLKVLLQQDFNGDNQIDILVELINGCGGNCCGNSYQFFINTGKGYYKSKSIGYDWNGLKIDSSSSEFKFIIETDNEGMNYDFPEYKKETFLIRDSIPLLIEVNRPERTISNYDILSSEFANDTLTSKQHYIDLDNDGLIDTITYKKYERWGRMHWSIDFGNGVKYKANDAVKRIGILSTKTNGVRDIVIDINTIKKWNGTEYK